MAQTKASACTEFIQVCADWLLPSTIVKLSEVWHSMTTFVELHKTWSLPAAVTLSSYIHFFLLGSFKAPLSLYLLKDEARRWPSFQTPLSPGRDLLLSCLNKQNAVTQLHSVIPAPGWEQEVIKYCTCNLYEKELLSVI